ncbi:MAG TPA: MrpF/PhaF family protein [Acidobacteriaceae bacterium]|nr:MrpF/PhaF family protein [Acidobacteriaceae bacterium]
MNLWLMAGGGVCLSLIPCAFLCLTGKAERRLVGFQMASLVIILALVIFTVAFGRMPFIDIALTAAIMSFGGGIVFARFLEKHL